MNVIIRAMEFAAKAHAGQVRKYTGEPYIQHPMAVAILVASATSNESAIAAALLHDVVEDCDVSLDDVRTIFGEQVSSFVYWVTDPAQRESETRAKWKTRCLDFIKQAPKEAKLIKLADIIDNTKSIAERDPEFAKIYMREKVNLMRHLNGVNKGLFDIADAIIGDYFAKQHHAGREKSNAV